MKAGERKRRRQLFEQLRLQAEILCDSHSDERVVLGRMMNIMLGLVKERRLNAQTRQALANHFVDSAFDPGANPTVELGGSFERDAIYLDGSFNIRDLAKRITWTDSRTEETINARD